MRFTLFLSLAMTMVQGIAMFWERRYEPFQEDLLGRDVLQLLPGIHFLFPITLGHEKRRGRRVSQRLSRIRSSLFSVRVFAHQGMTKLDVTNLMERMYLLKWVRTKKPSRLEKMRRLRIGNVKQYVTFMDDIRLSRKTRNRKRDAVTLLERMRVLAASRKGMYSR